MYNSFTNEPALEHHHTLSHVLCLPHQDNSNDDIVYKVAIAEFSVLISCAAFPALRVSLSAYASISRLIKQNHFAESAASFTSPDSFHFENSGLSICRHTCWN